MRVSSNLDASILLGIQQSASDYQTALQQVSTGQRVNLPGDDPTASALLVRTLAESGSVDQYTKNASAALGQAQTADSVLTSVVSLLTQAVTLGTQGATGTNTAENRKAIATQVQGVLASVVAAANTTYQGTAIFAGTASAPSAFVLNAAGTGYTYQGDSGVSTVQVNDNLQVQVNLPGDQVFTNGSGSALGSLGQLVTALQSGTSADISNAAASVTTALNYITAQHSVFGSSVNQINAQEAFLAQEKITLSTQATNLVGIDYATAAVNLSQASTHNSAVLAAAAKALPNTLLDYLK